jgi:hypothetical protein
MSSLKTMMRRILVMDRGTRLGRWCHPSSDAYKDTCDVSLKAFWSIYDHGFHTLPVARSPRDDGAKPSANPDAMRRDPITCFMGD